MRLARIDNLHQNLEAVITDLECLHWASFPVQGRCNILRVRMRLHVIDTASGEISEGGSQFVDARSQVGVALCVERE